MKCLSSHRNKSNSGLTLIELLIASTLGLILLAALILLFIFFSRSFLAIGNYADLDRHSRNALDVITKDVRQAAGVIALTNRTLVMSNLNGTVFSYRSNASTLIRTWTNGQTTVLLTNMDYWNVQLYQKTPTNNFQFSPATLNIPVTGKLVDMSWKCSRKIMGETVNTESVQTTKIVLRN